MKSCVTYIICFFLLLIIIGRCSNKALNKNIENRDISMDTIPVITEFQIKETTSFIENTIYRTEDYDVHPIKDYDYTPPKECYDGPIHVSIDSNEADIKVGNTYTLHHNIQSSKCYKVNDEKVARLKTDKGEIQIIINNIANKPHIRFYIKSDNLTIGLKSAISE